MNYRKKTRVRVAIIGAGIAGLGAAETFINRGFEDIVVLEAQNRFGGRIHSVRELGANYEYGAQWLHGLNNPLGCFAEKHDLLSTLTSTEGKGLFLYDDGTIINQQNVEIFCAIADGIIQNFDTYYTLGKEETVSEILKTAMNKTYLSKVKTDIDLLNWYMKYQCIDNACLNLEDLSAKDFGIYETDCMEGQEHINFKASFSSVVDKLVSLIPHDKLLLRKYVIRVYKNSHEVEVVCSDGTAYICKYLICTIPLGVLKDSSLFCSLHGIVDTKQFRAITSMGYGTIGKIFLRFCTNWWGNHEGFQFVRRINEEESEWDWSDEIIGFDVVTVGAPNTLVGWVTPRGTPSMENVPLEEIGHKCVTLLKNFNRMDISPLVRVHRTQWTSNPFIKGAYSYIPLHYDCERGESQRLLGPLHEQILFAGEAAHRKWFSTAHGAYDSGITEAERVLKFMYESTPISKYIAK